MTRWRILIALSLAAACRAQVAVEADTVYTMAGPAIHNGVVLMSGGKIERVGPAAQVKVPATYRVLRAKVATPGLVDAHSTVGLSGYLNTPQDQDQVEHSAPIQPELRAMDSYNPRETLIAYLRSLGVTTLHTGHGPGILLSGQTMVVKTTGATVEDAMVKPLAMVAVTLGEGAREEGKGKSPGTRAKEIALLRQEFIKAQEYQKKMDKLASAAPDKSDKDKSDKDKKEPPSRDLRLEMMAQVLKGQVPLLVTVNRANDIVTAIRLGREFNIHMVLDDVPEAYMVLDQIKASGYPVLVHPTMERAFGESENASFETASKLKAAGIPFALQSGFEGYVPKTRVVLFEAAIAAANGLGFDNALASITIDAARIVGVADRVGSLETGKDGDVALYDGDPFEYTTHCIGVVSDGKVVSEIRR